MVQNPDVKGRQEILDLYLQDKPLADDVDVKAIARGTPGFNGAGKSKSCLRNKKNNTYFIMTIYFLQNDRLGKFGECGRHQGCC